MQNIPKNLFEPAAANAGDAEKISKKEPFPLERCDASLPQQ